MHGETIKKENKSLQQTFQTWIDVDIKIGNFCEYSPKFLMQNVKEFCHTVWNLIPGLGHNTSFPFTFLNNAYGETTSYFRYSARLKAGTATKYIEK